MEYVYLLLHKMKANVISSSKYIADSDKVVDAIRSYCLILAREHKLSAEEKANIDRFNI